MLPEEHLRRSLLHQGIPEDQLEDTLDQVIKMTAQSIISLPKNPQKPVIGFTYRSQIDRLIQLLQHKGFPVLPSPERAARAMAALVRYQRIKEVRAQS
jgi:acyl-CoA synthetase (NDP forming)